MGLTCGHNVATLLPMKRRKPKAERKDEVIRLRVSPDQKRTMMQAAQAAGLELSAWLRSLGLREAARTASSPSLVPGYVK
jgi:uncharacterized protein (DUF1778 family)